MPKSLHIYIHTRDAPWNESAHPRAPNGEFGEASGGGGSGNRSGAIGKQLVELADLARSKSSENRVVEFGKVSSKAAAVASEKLGVDISGYSRVADMYAIKHTLNRHGNAKAEERIGQLAITDKDIAALPEVVSDPDLVVYGGKSRIGRDVLASIKRQADGTVLVIEEVRTGKKSLALVSMRKYPATRDATSVARTVSLNVRNDSEVKPIIHDCRPTSTPDENENSRF